MTFRKATDVLGMSASELADAFGLQPQTIRQMRLTPDAGSYRTPPAGWQAVILRLARRRSRELQTLIEDLEREGT